MQIYSNLVEIDIFNPNMLHAASIYTGTYIAKMCVKTILDV